MSAARVTVSAASPRIRTTLRGRPKRRAICRVIVRAAAAGKVTVTSLEEARGDAIPLSEAMGPDGPKGAAVFALLLPSPLGDRVHYVGVAKDAGNALASAASSTGIDPDDLKDVTVAWADLPKTARKPALQAAWKAWLGAVGYAPEGNTAVAASTPVEKTPSKPNAAIQSQEDAAKEAAAIADDVVSSEAIDKLCKDGFVILDDVLPKHVLTTCLTSANALARSKKTVNVGQEGRDDSIAVLRSDDLPAEGTAFGGLSPCARMLLAVPVALRARFAEREGSNPGGAESMVGGDKLPRETFARLATATAPDRLMLANYPGDGARYVTHLDNDPTDPGHSEGEPGLRACDRAVTAILYLNPNWEEAHGGCLRVQMEGGKGTIDVAPSAGRMVLFDCRRIAHEVLPSYTSRWAMTAWIND